MSQAPHQPSTPQLEGLVIDHPDFVRVRDALTLCFALAKRGIGDAPALAILGPSGSGKTTALKQLSQAHPPRRRRGRRRVPVLRVKVPSKPTVKGLALLLLHKLEEPLTVSGQRWGRTEADLTLCLERLLPATGTRVLMLDDFQHFVDKGTRRIQHHVADWLKNLVDETGVGLVIAGLPRARQVIEHNEQLARRFLAPQWLLRFRWEDRAQRETFFNLLITAHRCLRDLDPPPFADEDLGFRFYCATGGLIGYLLKLLRAAEDIARTSADGGLSLEVLQRAYELTIWAKAPGAPRPFDPSCTPEPSQALLDWIDGLGPEGAPLAIAGGAR